MDLSELHNCPNPVAFAVLRGIPWVVAVAFVVDVGWVVTVQHQHVSIISVDRCGFDSTHNSMNNALFPFLSLTVKPSTMPQNFLMPSSKRNLVHSQRDTLQGLADAQRGYGRGLRRSSGRLEDGR